MDNLKLNNHESGSTLTLFALSLTTIFLILGISIDLGSAYVLRSRLSKAVDAGVLSGARNMRNGDAEAIRTALEIARANYTGRRPVDFQAQIIQPTRDTKRIAITATSDTPTGFAVLLGLKSIAIASAAEATRYPLDMSLVLDQSYSLQSNGVFDDMQRASTRFIDYFNESADQIGISSYSTTAREQLSVQKFFKVEGTRSINAMRPLTYTNIQEGLRISKAQLDVAPNRTDALRVVVLFTDGRSTAFRDTNPYESPYCPTYDGVIATGSTGTSYAGLFRTSDGRKISSFTRPGCVVSTRGWGSPKPTSIFTGSTVNGDTIRAGAAIKAEQQADMIRAAGYSIYAIALGNLNARPGEDPDLDFLRRVTNEGGISDVTQPRGEMYFAPSAAELDDVFAELADRLLTRLTR